MPELDRLIADRYKPLVIVAADDHGWAGVADDVQTGATLWIRELDSDLTGDAATVEQFNSASVASRQLPSSSFAQVTESAYDPHRATVWAVAPMPPGAVPLVQLEGKLTAAAALSITAMVAGLVAIAERQGLHVRNPLMSIAFINVHGQLWCAEGWMTTPALAPDRLCVDLHRRLSGSDHSSSVEGLLDGAASFAECASRLKQRVKALSRQHPAMLAQVDTEITSALRAPRSRRRRRQLLVAGVLFAVTMAAAQYGAHRWVTQRPITVPAVDYAIERDAVASLQRREFEVRVERQASRFEAGQVIRQLPAAGAQVRRGSRVTLVVSDGAPRHPLPDVTGQLAADGAASLEFDGFIVTKVAVDGDRPGRVVRTDPAAGTPVAAGSPVTLYYVKAAEPSVSAR